MQDTTPSTADQGELVIRALIERYAQSIDAADTALGAEIWATTDEITFIHPRGHERGWDAVRTNFYEGTMRAPFADRRLTIHDPVIHIYGDAAWAEFSWDFVATFRSDGSKIITEGRETQIFQHWNGGWRLVHVHYSGLPVTEDREGF